MKSKIGTILLSAYLALTSANCDIHKPSEPKQGVSSSQPAKQELEDVIKLDFETWNFVLSPYRIAKDAFGAVIYAARDELKKKGQNEKDLSEQDITKLLIGVCQKMDASKDSFVDNFEAEGYLHPDESFEGKNPFYKPPEVAAVSKEADNSTKKPAQVVHEPEIVEQKDVKKEPKYEGKKVEESKEVEKPEKPVPEEKKPVEFSKEEIGKLVDDLIEKRTEKEVTVPTREKIAEVTGLDRNLVEACPEVGFEYSGASGTLDEMKAVYDMEHDKVRVFQDGDVYIVKPKSGDSALYIRIKGGTIEVKYDPKEKGFYGGTIEEQNIIGAEADTDKKDKILTFKEMCKLIYDTFQEWKAKHPKIEQVKPEEHRDDYFKSTELEDLEGLDELFSE